MPKPTFGALGVSSYPALQLLDRSRPWLNLSGNPLMGQGRLGSQGPLAQLDLANWRKEAIPPSQVNRASDA